MRFLFLERCDFMKCPALLHVLKDSKFSTLLHVKKEFSFISIFSTERRQ